MNYYSTRDERHEAPVDFGKALLYGQAPDGGLYLPEKLPRLDDKIIEQFAGQSLPDIGVRVAEALVQPSLNKVDLENVVRDACNFDAPLVRLDDKRSILELFHGPTLAFKDFGARFMARAFQKLHTSDEPIVVLAATSGDTGSAVAQGFYNVEGIEVCLLYPKGKVSRIQRKQMTTLGGNVTALEVDGTFDDCQRLVKDAFADEALRNEIQLTSANSINIGRLLPQMFYYFRAYAQLDDAEKQKEPVFVVPSGNLGNLTAGLMAHKMGLPVHRFVGAVNRNDVFHTYLQSGRYEPRDSVPTLSNAMDVGRPSNLERIRGLYHDDPKKIRLDIQTSSWSDEATKETIGHVYQQKHYVLDPHGAVGWKAAEAWIGKNDSDHERSVIVLETAHPAKFPETVEEVIGENVKTPQRLADCLDRPSKSKPVDSTFVGLKEVLRELYG